MSKTLYEVADLLRVMERLRDPETGCPWDLRQNSMSIIDSTLEECYELAAAIEQGDQRGIADELGDVLFQVVFHSRLGQEQGQFSFATVVDGLVRKLVRRHPHVFAGGDIDAEVKTAGEEGEEHRLTSGQVRDSWEAIKQRERDDRSQSGALADVPLALPALPRAQKLQKRAARVNFDWPGSEPVLAKLLEELDELRAAMAADDPEAVSEEMGDLLFSCVNLARHLEVDAETCLRLSSRKFESRFNMMEQRIAEDGGDIAHMEADEVDSYWRQAKKALSTGHL